MDLSNPPKCKRESCTNQVKTYYSYEFGYQIVSWRIYCSKRCSAKNTAAQRDPDSKIRSGKTNSINNQIRRLKGRTEYEYYHQDVFVVGSYKKGRDLKLALIACGYNKDLSVTA